MENSKKDKLTVLSYIRTVCNSRNIMETFTRREIVSYLKPLGFSESSIDNTRKLLCHGEYIERMARDGEFKILAAIPDDLTLSQLNLRAYPAKFPLNKSKCNLRHEWRGWYAALNFGI